MSKANLIWTCSNGNIFIKKFTVRIFFYKFFDFYTEIIYILLVS